MSPKVTPEHSEARRQQILLAACICMSKKGFRQTSMQEICRTAKLSPGAVYTYFKSKEDILRTLAAEGVEYSSQLLADMATAKELRPAIRRFFEFLRECDRQNESQIPEELDLQRLKVGLWAEAVQDPKIGKLVEKQAEAFTKPATTLVRRAQRNGEVRRGIDPKSVTHVLGSLWEGLTLQRALDPDMDPDRYMEAVYALIDGTLWEGEKKAAPKKKTKKKSKSKRSKA
jgi:AcrR family transcriptional regulator